MKISKLLLQSALLIFALSFAACSGNGIEQHAELDGLSYSTGETSLGATTVYTSAKPAVFTSSSVTFAIAGITHNGSAYDNSTTQMFAINSSTGVITATPGTDPGAAGEYIVAVKLTNATTERTYDSAFRLVVKGIVFGNSSYTTDMGTALEITPDKIYLAQQSGTKFDLVIPSGKDYTGISVDSLTCKVKFDATVEAGVYPVSVSVTNLTNASGYTISNLLSVTVESKPYGLVYSPASYTLGAGEGIVTPAPTVKAATVAEGNKVTFAIASNPAEGQFTIDPSTGSISLAENNTLPHTKTTYNINVTVSNSKGSATFANALAITVDPDILPTPITALNYSDSFPVTLLPGQGWVSNRPTVTGSTIGLHFSLENAPEGVSIDASSGIITFAAGHKMPLKTSDNTLTVNVINGGMSAPLTATVGDFAINSVVWSIKYKSNDASNALVNSGVDNMDRYTFMGELIQGSASSVQIKNGWGRSSSGNYLDYLGVNTATASSNGASTNQNNDWMVSEQINCASYLHSLYINFDFGSRYGTAAQNRFEVYIIDDSSNTYSTGPQNQNAADNLAATPAGLTWELVTEITTHVNGDLNTKSQAMSFKIDEKYKGKKVRLALRVFNPSADNNNTRSYRVNNLRVEDAIE